MLRVADLLHRGEVACDASTWLGSVVVLRTVLYGKKSPENSKKSGKLPKMSVRRALRARRTPIILNFPEFSGIFRLDFFSVLMNTFASRPALKQTGSFAGGFADYYRSFRADHRRLSQIIEVFRRCFADDRSLLPEKVPKPKFA